MHACLSSSTFGLSIHYVQIDRLAYATFRVCHNIGLIRFGEDVTYWPTCLLLMGSM